MKEKEKIKQYAKSIKIGFINYFDGFDSIEPIGRTTTTYIMGVCKLEYDNGILTVHLRRPGLLIGKGGRTIDAVSQYLDCEINIIEVDLLK